MEKAEDILLNELRPLISWTRGEPVILSLLPELTLSIIHKINNKMTPLLGYTQILMSSSTEENKQKLNKIYNSGATVSSILNSLFEYIKSLPFPKRMWELSTLIKELIEEDERFKGIEFNFIVEEPVSLPINKLQIKEAFRRILDNSFEAMDKPEKKMEIKISKSDNNALIEFWDNGEGIDSYVLPNIFEPFFTTKEGKAGLGLSFVHGIVKNHGGENIVESEKGKWTKIIISLPITPFEWKEENILLIAPENDFYKILFDLAKEESIKIEWIKGVAGFSIDDFTHIIIDEETEGAEEFIERARTSERKIIVVGDRERERTILVKKPPSILKIISLIN